MDVVTAIGRLYPLALGLANLGVGAGLYLTGAVFFAVLLSASGVLVLLALVSAATRSSGLAALPTE
jgi:hypothetical protein